MSKSEVVTKVLGEIIAEIGLIVLAAWILESQLPHFGTHPGFWPCFWVCIALGLAVNASRPTTKN